MIALFYRLYTQLVRGIDQYPLFSKILTSKNLTLFLKNMTSKIFSFFLIIWIKKYAYYAWSHLKHCAHNWCQEYLSTPIL